MKHLFKYRVTIKLNQSNEDFMDWLVKQHGPGGIRKTSCWNADTSTKSVEQDSIDIIFKEPQHATAFALKWA